MKRLKTILGKLYRSSWLKYGVVTLFAVVLIGFVDQNSIWNHFRNKQHIQELQEEITRFRVEKSESELEYIQARYDEIKKETENYQEQLAKINDRSQNMTGSYYRIEQERIQAKYNLANGIYNEMAKQLEQGKIQVKKDTPVFTVIQPVTVPSQPSNSRSKTLIVWTFLGFILGCGIVLAKGYWPKLKEQFNA